MDDNAAIVVIGDAAVTSCDSSCPTSVLEVSWVHGLVSSSKFEEVGTGRGSFTMVSVSLISISSSSSHLL